MQTVTYSAAAITSLSTIQAGTLFPRTGKLGEMV